MSASKNANDYTFGQLQVSCVWHLNSSYCSNAGVLLLHVDRSPALQ
jgi:hypothetical protein